MRNEDKLLLLVELVDGDVSSFIKEKNIEFHQSEILFKIDELIKQNRHSKSPKYLIAQREYEKLKKLNIKSLEEYFIGVAKANRILSSLLNKEFINPLMCSQDEANVSLASLSVEVDNKNAYLGDIIMSELYSDNHKIDVVKQCVINWKKEVDETFIRPLQLLLTYPKNLPNKRKVPLNKIFIGIFLAIVNVILIVSLFFKDNYIRPILEFDYSNYLVSIPYITLFILTVIYDFTFVFLLTKRNNEHLEYFYAQDKLLANSRLIMDTIDNNTEKLYQKILNCIVKKQEIIGPVNQYSISEIDMAALSYLIEENERPELEEDHVSNYEVVLIELIVVILIYFIGLIILFRIGVIK